MRKVLLSITIFFLFSGRLLCRELAINGGFETGSGGVPEPWSNYSGILRPNNEHALSGLYCAQLNGNSGTSSSKYIYQVVQDIQAGRNYCLSGYTLTNSADISAVKLQIYFYSSDDGTGSNIGAVDSNSVVLNDQDWQFLTTGVVQSPPESGSVKIRCTVTYIAPPVDASCYFDDISLEAVQSDFTRDASFEVSQSPFSPYGGGRYSESIISYSVTSASSVSLKIYDVNGRMVRTLMDTQIIPSQGLVAWDGKDDNGDIVPVGIYICYIEAVEGSTGKLTRDKKTIVVGKRL